MKLKQDEKKAILETLKMFFKEKGYKGGRELAYKKSGENFICIMYSIAESKRLLIMVEIKKYIYDDFFWDIMNMSGNKKLGDSFRANGVFVSPSIMIKRKILEPLHYSEKLLRELVNDVQIEIDSFVEENDINEYILRKADLIEERKLPDGDTLKCLAYCDVGKIDEAKELAKQRIRQGDTGSFESEGKGFFEWMLLFKYLN